MLVYKPNKVKCKKCGHTTFVRKLKELVEIEIETNGEDVLGYNDVMLGSEIDETRFACFNCGQKWDGV